MLKWNVCKELPLKSGSQPSAKCWLLSLLCSDDISEHVAGSTRFTSSSLDGLLRHLFGVSSCLLTEFVTSRGSLRRRFPYQTGSANCMACNHMLQLCCGEFLFLETQRSLLRRAWSRHMVTLGARDEFPLHMNAAVVQRWLSLWGLASSLSEHSKIVPCSHLKSDLSKRRRRIIILHYFCPFLTEMWASRWCL